MKSTLLITGGSGLLAVNWAVKMRESFNVVLLLHNRHILINGVVSLNADISSFLHLKTIVLKYRPLAVIHTACLTSVESCEQHPVYAYEVNVKITENIAKVTQFLGVKMIHISTDHLFSGNESFVSEEVMTSACNVYGNTKALAEEKVLKFNEDSLILRTNFYGFGTSYRKSFSDMIIFSLTNCVPITLYHNVYYTPIYISELISLAHVLIERNAQGIFNLVSDNRISKYEFGILLADEFGLGKDFIRKGELMFNSSSVTRPLDMSLSNLKFTRLTGISIGNVGVHIKKMKTEFNTFNSKEIQAL